MRILDLFVRDLDLDLDLDPMTFIYTQSKIRPTAWECVHVAVVARGHFRSRD